MSRIGTTASGRWSDKNQSGRTAQIEGWRRQRRQVEVERDPRELEGGTGSGKDGRIDGWNGVGQPAQRAWEDGSRKRIMVASPATNGSPVDYIRYTPTWNRVHGPGQVGAAASQVPETEQRSFPSSNVTSLPRKETH